MEMSHNPKNASSQSIHTPSSDVTTHQNADRHSSFTEIIRFTIIAVIIVLPIRLFVAQPFIVSGASMEHTFSTGEYLIVDQLTYHLDNPKRGDVVIFRYPRDPSKFYIKRIIGLPGDTVRISNNEVTIVNATYPDGMVLNEDYIVHTRPLGIITQTLGTDEYFVMGDNRDASSDSRSWGVLHRNYIIGRAFLRLFPLDTIDVLPGARNIEEETQLP